MNEAQTRLDKVNPKLRECGWGVVKESRILVEQNAYKLTNGKIGSSSSRALKVDYILVYKGVKLAIIEAKSDEKDYNEGVAQAKLYAQMMNIRFTYATNGDKIYEIDMLTGMEDEIDSYPTPEELWDNTYRELDEWKEKFLLTPFFTKPDKTPRYYQENAVNKVLDAIAKKRNRILLTLATGTGKTFIAFQIAWKLYQTKWNNKGDDRRPRILFLADRNILANQAQTDFGGFDEKLCLRITPRTFRENKNVPTAQNIYFTIFSTFMTPEGEPSYKQYDENFFDLIIIDECHRGGANDESRWRDILDYFSSAFQLGLTATPKRTDNVNTYEYFGEPVYQYSLKQGIEDGFLTPFRHVVMKTTIDEYIYSVDDDIIEGEDLIDEDKVYEEKDFYYGNIEIVKRDELRVKEMLNEINPNDKTLVFCYNQSHAAKIRDMINRLSNSKNPNYCVRVTANDGTIGENYLRQFQDNENLIPTILTTSHKLSTGVDARNIRNIVLMRPINSMIEFKQIIGRGTRIFDNKLYFSILDFVKAYEKYQDPQWDGEPICPRCNQVDCICDGNEPPRVCSKCGQKPCVCKKEPCGICGESPCVCGKEPCRVCGQLPCVCKKKKIVIKLSDKREIEVIKDYMFMDVDGKPISTKEFIEKIFGHLPQYFNSKEELIKIWANPLSREELLNKLEIAGFGIDKLTSLQEIIDAKDSDLLDVLEYIAYSIEPIKRMDRVEENKDNIYSHLNVNQKDFVDFLVDLYIKAGVSQLSNSNIKDVINMKYNSLEDAKKNLGNISSIKEVFTNFQKSLYGDKS